MSIQSVRPLLKYVIVSYQVQLKDVVPLPDQEIRSHTFLCGAVGGQERSSLTSDFSADTVDVFTVCAVVCSRHRKRTSSSVWHHLTFHPHRNTIFQNKSFTSIPVFDVTPLIECVL